MKRITIAFGVALITLLLLIVPLDAAQEEECDTLYQQAHALLQAAMEALDVYDPATAVASINAAEELIESCGSAESPVMPSGYPLLISVERDAVLRNSAEGLDVFDLYYEIEEDGDLGEVEVVLQVDVGDQRYEFLATEPLILSAPAGWISGEDWAQADIWSMVMTFSHLRGEGYARVAFYRWRPRPQEGETAEPRLESDRLSPWLSVPTTLE